MHTVLSLRPSDRLEDKDLNRLASFVSVFIPHIVSRSPESVRYATNRAGDVFETMRELNMGSSEKLKELYRETQSGEEFDETLAFDPKAIAEQISLWMQIFPEISKDEDFVRASSLHEAVEYLRDCSMLVLTTSLGHPFIGIDKPIRTVITGNLTTLYYPLSSQVAVILTDDGQHTFEKRSVSYRQLKDFNDYDMEGRTYRYFRGVPQYAFGHGLSYTTFKYGRPRLKKMADGSKAVVVKVKNKGQMDGDEIVQLYVTKLKGFSTYGSLTTLMLVMFWLYFCCYFVMLGAEINEMLRRDGLLAKKKKKQVEKPASE